MAQGDALKRYRAEQAAKKSGTSVETTMTLEPFRPKKKVPEVSEADKMYHFQLCVEFPQNWKPTDKATGKSLTPPYPKHYVIPNEGIAYDEEYVNEAGNLAPMARKWRYIEGQPSIWVDEQPGLEGMDEKAIDKMLSNNEIEFVYGQLNIRGIHTLKLKALQVQDIFEGKSVQYQYKNREYRLNNPDVLVTNDLSKIDREYLAMKLAQECTVEHMLECAFIMGIDIEDQSEHGLNKIKLEFVSRAKLDPQNPQGLEWFTGIVNGPTTHATYVFSQGLAQGIISATQQPGKITWTKANQAIMDSAGSNPVDFLIGKYFDKDEKVVLLLKELEKQV